VEGITHTETILVCF